MGVAVSEGFSFAMKNRFPPLFPQTKFVMVLGSKGEIRVVWLAFVTDEPKPNISATPHILKLITRDLRAAEKAADAGVDMDYVVVHTTLKELDDYLQKRQTGAFSRAA